MKVVIPYVGELQGPDARLARLVEFLGIPCERLRLPTGANVAELKKAVRDQTSCLVVNPRVMEEWLGPAGIPTDVVSDFLACFQHLLVHSVRADHSFDNTTVATLSANRLSSVRRIDGTSPVYEIASDSKDICGVFAGISFGPANSSNDHVFSVGGSGARELISVGGQPFMASVSMEGTEVVFVASEDVVDLDAESSGPLAEYFSRLMPQAMALRYAAGDECWRPSKAFASITIDDPLLRKRYGFLNFDSLLRLANQHNFHTAIAFIPHNFRRNSTRITRMFQENAARLSICFHGNDHTAAEFASTDMALLDALVRVAEERMDLHRQTTGLPCDRVMVFPQGDFSVEAMKVLKFHNFYAAVNTVPHPAGQPVRLPIGELAQPAVLRYGGFPLFVRTTIRQTQSHEIAFNLFFGRPVLIGEHHDVFQRPELLGEIAARIKSVAPEIQWGNLATVVGSSTLVRRAPDGTHHVRAYSSTVLISNASDSLRRYSIEWNDFHSGAPVEQVLVDGLLSPGFAADGNEIRLSVELAPRSSRTFSLVHQNVYATPGRLGFRWSVLAFIRRRLSELRDNYLSKNQYLLKTAKALQRRYLG